MLDQQRHNRRLALSDGERDRFLALARTCRVASTSYDGSPHLSALWFVWDGSSIWLNSLVSSLRWANLRRDPRLSVLVDDGDSYDTLRGVEISGRATVVGEVPRIGEPSTELVVPEQMYAKKYGAGTVGHDGLHAWLEVVPVRIVSWDFGKRSIA